MSGARDAGLGLKSEDLRAALVEALAGRDTRLGDLLARHGGLPGPRPNLTLAAAFGEAVAREGKGARRLLAALAADPAIAESARAFLPIAASYGYVARLESDTKDAWTAIFDLLADDRMPVRVGITAALITWAARAPGNLDQLIAEADHWLEYDDREHRDAATAIVLDVISDRQALLGATNREGVLAWVTRALASAADAPRAAERSIARRKVLAALPGAVSEIGSAMRGTPDGIEWIAARAAETRHPDVRLAMDQAIDRLRRGGQSQGSANIDVLRDALASSAKPPRDPSRIREGTGRGKKGNRRSR